MSEKKKKQTISDEILNLLKPKKLHDGDEIEAEDTVAKFEEFDEGFDVNQQLSDIRKKNVKSLNDLDQKYKGKVVSRKELEEDDFLESSDEEELENDNEDQSESDDDMAEEEENGEDPEKSDVEEAEDSEDENEDEEDESDNEEDPGDEFDISQFSKSTSQNLQDSLLEYSQQEETEILKSQSVNEEVKKGICVQNQLKIWEKLLEVRIKSQKMLITANSLPNFENHSNLCELEDQSFSEKAEKTVKNVSNLLDQMMELQNVLVNRFPETNNLLGSRKRPSESDAETSLMLKNPKISEFADKIEENYELYQPYRNTVIQKWHDRTKTVKNDKNSLANLNILTKIENSLLNRNELIKKTQAYRGDYQIYGVTKPQQDNQDEVTIPEIFDDSEFYHQLLRELIEYKTNTSDNPTEITKKFIELQKVRSKMKKKVDTRASKGRKIRYIVHNKLVNFMAPRDTSEWTDESKTELYNSLFGKMN